MSVANGRAAAPVFFAAPELAKAGYPVFPAKGKEPSVEGGFYAGTTDLSQVASWIEEGREHHDVAFAAGLPSGVVVVDADTPETFAEMRREYGEPTVLTRRGGHWYFRHPRNGKIPSNNVRAGLDRKGDGGYVAAPPSRGRAWTDGIPDRSALPILPREFWPKKAEKSEAPRSLPQSDKDAAAETIAGRVYRVPQGKRHEHLRHLCGVLLARGVEAGDAEDVLIAAWTKVGGELAERAGREVPNTLATTEQALAEGRATGVPSLEEITPGLYAELESAFGWRAEITFGGKRRGGSGEETDAPDEGEERKLTQAELLVRCAEGADLFHTPAGDSYATVPVNDHRETHPVRAKGFRRWLVRAFFERYGRPPGNQALQDALGLLEARAEFDGPERGVYVRIAGHAGNVYVDLANEGWQVVEITPSGWHITKGEAAPVRFRRPRGMLSLPTPRPGHAGDDDDGCDGLLRRFINVSSAEDLRVIVGWLLAALRPTGPYPVLLFQGEQGSAKSTAERLIRALGDPSAAPLRTTPRSEHDLFIAADNSHIVALDNISTLQPWLSDALCRLSTGGGFSTRTLYENREEELFDGMKPVILNGITDVASRPDLLDRAVVVSLPPIPDEQRRPEAELWREFEQARPAILASLFDAVSGALRSVEAVRLEGMPRMADFAVWATAAEDSLGWEPGAFMAAYADNRQEATDTALDADPVAGAVLELMAGRDEWTGSATELWAVLGELAGEGIRHTKAWPGAPNALTGRLKRLAPTLRGIGIEYGEDRSGRSRKKVLTKNKPAKDRHDRHYRHSDEKGLQNGTFTGDGPGDGLYGGGGPHRHSDGPVRKTVTPETRIDKGNPADSDGRDGDDDDVQVFSKPLSHNPKPGQSATLEDLRTRRQGRRLTSSEVLEELARSGSGAAKQAGLYHAGEISEENAIEWTTKAILARRQMDTSGWRRHARAVEAALTHGMGCECEECS
jgi:hypothetical protein